MQKYKNLPGVSVELLDGNLVIDNGDLGRVVLIVGLAESGPSNTQYLVQDINQARLIYGVDSPIIARLAEVRAGGAENVILYRVGGNAAVLENLFGDGSLVFTREQMSVSGSKYSVYAGPSPANPLVSGMIVFEGDRIIYSNMPGSEVDNQMMYVNAFDTSFQYTIGTPTSPVVFGDILDVTWAALDTTFTADGIVDTFALPSSEVMITGVTLDGVDVAVVDYSLGLAEVIFTTAPAIGTLVVSTTSLAMGNIKANTLNTYTADGVATSWTLPNGIMSVVEVKLDGALVASTNYTYANGVITFSVAPVSGTLIIETMSWVDPANIATAPVYIPGADHLSATWEEYYELVDIAYADLETTVATELFVDKALLDVPNLADGSAAVDKLTYSRKEEINGVIEYFWSTTKVIYQNVGALNDETLLIAEADIDDNGQPIVKNEFHEVNFAHQMGEWLHTITENDRFVLGGLGTSLPLNDTTSVVAKWIGSLPAENKFGDIVADGAGLLGNKFMSGSVSRKSGFYKTESGYPDGIIEKDSNGVDIDLGKMMSIIPAVGTTPARQSFGLRLDRVSAASTYMGLVSTIGPGFSTTNQPLLSLELPFLIKKSKLDELAGSGYVMLAAKTIGTVVVSGELATSNDSDYDYVSTTIIVGNIIRRIRERLEPFIGQGLNDVLIAAADTAVEGIFQEEAASGSIVKYTFAVNADMTGRGVGALDIPITIVPAFELRLVGVPIKLAYDI